MSTIQLRGARISTINFAGNESGIICRIHFRADLSRPVADRMGWAILTGDSETELISGLGKTFPLKGELSVESAKLTPNGLLKNQAIEFIGIGIKDFKVATKGGGSDPLQIASGRLTKKECVKAAKMAISLMKRFEEEGKQAP